MDQSQVCGASRHEDDKGDQGREFRAVARSRGRAFDSGLARVEADRKNLSNLGPNVQLVADMPAQVLMVAQLNWRKYPPREL
jgi:hypothetical protein